MLPMPSSVCPQLKFQCRDWSVKRPGRAAFLSSTGSNIAASSDLCSAGLYYINMFNALGQFL